MDRELNVSIHKSSNMPKPKATAVYSWAAILYQQITGQNPWMQMMDGYQLRITDLKVKEISPLLCPSIPSVMHEKIHQLQSPIATIYLLMSSWIENPSFSINSPSLGCIKESMSSKSSFSFGVTVNSIIGWGFRLTQGYQSSFVISNLPLPILSMISVYFYFKFG